MKEDSFSSLVESMITWKRKRYGITQAKPMYIKFRRSFEIFLKNRNSFIILIIAYFLFETISNAAILSLQWTLDKTIDKSNKKMIIVQLTASFPFKIVHSILDYCVLYVYMGSIKRAGNTFDKEDLKNAIKSLNFNVLVKIVFMNELLSSPIIKAFALLSSDVLYSFPYFIIGIFLNWLFFMAPFFLIESRNISILQCLIWSALTSFDAQYSTCIFITTVLSIILSPIVLFTPFLIILQLLNFYEIFGYSSPSEVQLTATQ